MTYALLLIVFHHVFVIDHGLTLDDCLPLETAVTACSLEEN